MDIYGTAILNGVVDNLKIAQAAILNLVFRQVIISETEKIYFDVEVGKRRIAPFVHPTHSGKVVQSHGFQTKDFEPAYVKDKRVFDPNRALKRSIGEKLTGNLRGQDRTRANLAIELLDQQQMITRREEIMAIEALLTGKVTIDGIGFDSVLVDFGRNAGHTVTLAGATRWGQAGVVPVQDMEDWSTTVLQNEGAVVDTAIFDVLAWRLFAADPVSKDAVNTDYKQVDAMRITNFATLGLKYKGTFDGVEIYVYQDWYVNDSNVEVPMVPDNTVMLLATGPRGINGIRHYGAIRDVEAGLQARRTFTKSKVEFDPSVQTLLTQSAPFAVPGRPNGSFAATVN